MMKITTEISGLNNAKLLRLAKQTAKLTIEQEIGKISDSEIELSVAFVAPEVIRKVNKRYRGKDCVTDVLSFCDEDFLKRKSERKLQKRELLGELLVCGQQVKNDAAELKTSFNRELAWVLMHGILHLLGYDHEANEKNARIMRQKEDEYLSKLDFKSIKPKA